MAANSYKRCSESDLLPQWFRRSNARDRKQQSTCYHIHVWRHQRNIQTDSCPR